VKNYEIKKDRERETERADWGSGEEGGRELGPTCEGQNGAISSSLE
jgi:hypothetical protein